MGCSKSVRYVRKSVLLSIAGIYWVLAINVSANKPQIAWQLLKQRGAEVERERETNMTCHKH